MGSSVTQHNYDLAVNTDSLNEYPDKGAPSPVSERIHIEDARPIPFQDPEYFRYFGIENGKESSQFQLLNQPDITTQVLATIGNPRCDDTLNLIRKILKHSHLTGNKGTPMSLGSPQAGLNPRADSIDMFSSLSSGSVVSGGTEDSQIFGRSVYRRPQNLMKLSHGWLQYKGTCPYNPDSTPIHMTVPYEALEGELLEKYLATPTTYDLKNHYAVSEALHDLTWEIYGANTRSDTIHEIKNALRFVDVYLKLFKELPSIQLPLEISEVTSLPVNNVVASPESVLAARSEIYSDEKDMLIIWVL